MSTAKRHLVPVRSTAEAAERGRRGGLASGRARRAKKDIQMALRNLLEGKNTEGLTGSEQIALAMFREALAGNVKAFSEIRDTVYGKPASVVDMKSSDGSMSPKGVAIDITQVSDDPVEAAQQYDRIMNA